MFNLFKKKPKFPDVNWYCDNCGDYLNDQEGFDDHCGDWKCTNCGYVNKIVEDNIIYDENDEDDDDYGSDERLPVYEAALIWQSNGFDEDYTFGYSEEELKDALKDDF